MTIRTFVSGAAILIFSTLSPVQAADKETDEHAGHHAPAAPTGQDPRAGISAIEALMGRITATSDAGERRRLLAQHLGALRDQMRLVRAAHTTKGKEDAHAGHGETADNNASDDKAGGGMMERKMKGGGMMKMHKKVEARLDMLERMLQQLIEHEAVEREMEEE